jgi:hypothetical protein
LAVEVRSAIRELRKPPGVNWPDQEFEVESSLSFTDNAVIANGEEAVKRL